MDEFVSLDVKHIVGKVDNFTRIEGVKVRKQKLIADDRGFLMEMMRPDWEEFEEFGQSYVTMCNPGVAKCWHLHCVQVDFFNCVSGLAKVALFDDRVGSPTRGVINVFFIGPTNPLMIRIPNLVWHGFMATGNEPALIVNTPTKMYDYDAPDEYKAPWNSFNYDWYDING